MTQYRDRERKAPLDSYLLARRDQGVIHWGRYQGFDTLTGISGLNFELSHAGSAHVNYARDTYALTPNLGVWRSRQGINITEDANIALTCLTNAANAFVRIDAVVGIHQYSDSVTGGTAATYAVIKGADGGPVKPTTTANTQVILGYIYVPASAATLTSATWEPADVLGLGGLSIARKDAVNRFTAQQQWKAEDTEITLVEITLPSAGRTRQLLPLPVPMTANMYSVLADTSPTVNRIQGIPAAPTGTILMLYVTGFELTIDSYALNAAEKAAGYQDLEYFTINDSIDRLIPYNSVMMLVSEYSQVAGFQVWRVCFVTADWDLLYQAVADIAALTSGKADARAVGATPKTTITHSLGTFKYFRDTLNNVHIWGSWTVANQNFTNYNVGTLPAGFRPSATDPIYHTGPSTSVNGGFNLTKIDSNGDIIVNGQNNIVGAVMKFYISYPAEA